MELTDPQDIYAYHLGSVWGRLLSLEALLRIAISKGAFRAPAGVHQGDEVEADALNQWGFLSDLIQKYNGMVATSHSEFTLVNGNDIVQLRNALAHGMAGRIGQEGDAEPGPMRLVKFGRLNTATKKVSVEFAADMTTEWLARQRALVQVAIQTAASYVTTTWVRRE